MAALLTSDLNDIDRIAIEIAECERLGIKVMPSDVNESFVDFGVVKETGNIRFGLGAIKGIGETPARIIVRERKKNGPFKSLEDFIDRMIKTEVEEAGDRVILNKKILESLAKSGALDSLAERAQVLAGMETITKRIQESSRVRKSSQMGLFGEVLSANIELGRLELPEVEPASKGERLAWEKELLGIYLSEHPLREYGSALKSAVSHQLSTISKDMEGKRVKVGGIISNIKKINTRSGQPMLFVGIEDLSGKSELLVFPKLLAETPELWQVDNIVLVEGKISTKDNDVKILADKAEKFDLEKAKKEHIVTVSDEDEVVEIDLNEESEAESLTNILSEKFEEGELAFEFEENFYVILPKGTTKKKLLELKEVFEKYPGDLPLVLAYKRDGKFDFARTKIKINPKKELIKELLSVLV
jgi:DNA polymerase-3 subunit alpha